MIPRETIDRIFAAAKIEEVVSDYVTLRKRGANLIGLCPFHTEKTGSFTVSPSKGIYKCFGCGASGHALKFIMEIEQCTFVEAVKQLGKKYHIEVEEREMTAEEQQRQDNRESMFVVNDFANKWFQSQLWDTPEGQAIGLGYFRERGLRDDIIRKFQLGYSPEKGNPLAKALKEKGFKEEFIVNDVDTKIGVGVVGKSEDGRLYDRFRDRVMFPIFTVSGKPVAFAGRILKKKENVGKYVNSPDSIIYSKTNELYGLFQAKQAISRADMCYLVEGQMDVISMHQSGIENVVASSGTALTEGHINLVKRFTKRLTFIYDSDAAGIKASLRGIDMVLEAGMEVKIVLLPDGEDPDSFAQAHEKAEIEEYIAAHEQDFVSFKMAILSKDVAANDIYGRSQMINDIVRTVSMIPDDITRNVYVESVATAFSLRPESLFAQVGRLRGQRLEQLASRRSQDSDDARQLPPEVSDGSYSTDPVQKAQSGASANGYLDVCERELTELLVRWGEYTIHWEANMVYGAEQIPEVTVSEYIRSSLEQDDLELTNPLYKKIYDEYFLLDTTGNDDCEVKQGRIIKYYTFHDDPEVVRIVTEMLSDSHRLTIKAYTDSVTPREHRLSHDVPRAVLQYKSRTVRLQQTEIQKEIAAAEKSGESRKKPELLQALMMLNRVRSQLDKELKKY